MRKWYIRNCFRLFTSQHYDVTLIEAKEKLGGHTYSMSVHDLTFNNLHVDIGFIVFNLINYPLFTKFLTN